jgi:glycosyltransferase involved in cell wall biosynthesis
MTVLFGHPTGNPNSHHAALAHFEAGRLEAFCVPWMPSDATLRVLESIGPLRPMAQRLSRRRFTPLSSAPTVQGRFSELRRLATRAIGRGDEGLSYEANDWLMRTMARETRRATVTAVHAYEDCSLLQFETGKRLGKACIYDMPIGYYPAWKATEAELARRYADWLPPGGLPSSHYVRPAQKRKEMELADLVLVPGTFVEKTIREFHPDKRIVRAPYGVGGDFWHSPSREPRDAPLRFIYAGQLSLRKGIPILLNAWEKAALDDAELELVGVWQLAPTKRALPRGVTLVAPLSRDALREHFRASDVFVFPSFFEGLSLTLMEAMACGLPAVATEAIASPDVVTQACGRLVGAGELDALVEALHWCVDHREELPSMGRAARVRAEGWTWENYRRCVSDAVASFI